MDGTMTIYPMVATRSEVHQGVFDDVSRGFHIAKPATVLAS